MAFLYRVTLLASLFSISAGLFAAQITGTVTNGTTNKPASGDEVVLLSLAGGMQEVARTRTDNQGRFTLNVPDEGVQHLVRVTRQSVNYFKGVPPGTSSADVTVYDAATQLQGIVRDAVVYRVQAVGGEMDVHETHTIRNQSQPPRSKIGNQTFAVSLPEGAQVTETSTTGSSGMPTTVNPVPSETKNRYAFDFAIRPGTSTFDVMYKMPYNGAYEFTLTPETPMSELGVLLPKSMKFTGTSGSFAQDTDEAGMAVFFTKNVAANQQVKFSVSGVGEAPVQGAAGESSAPQTASTPEASSKSMWYLIAVMGVIVVGGAIWLWRKTAAVKPAKEPRATPPPSTSRAEVARQPARAPSASQGSMMDVLKDELFQLETDRLNGKISQEDYEKTKAGLDTLLRRQMKKD